MKIRLVAGLCLLAGRAAVTAASPGVQNVCSGDPDHPRQLFNGKDLTG